jgi:hypothetical protein
MDDLKLTIQRVDQPSAILRIWRGSQKNPFVRYRYKSVEDRDASKTKYILAEKKFFIEKEMEKKRKKKIAKEELASLSIGDIFVSSWGYEQTNVDFFQLISLKGQTGEFKSISYHTIEVTGPMSEYVRPSPNEFVGNNTFKARLNGNGFKINSYSHARKIEDPTTSKHYHSWYA